MEVDGKIVPNYDATIKPFEEGDVVGGEVVRIDKDEVLVDIGYKSEGVIPANELSIRRSVDPAEEVTLGEQVDALVLTKEDQEGRLVLSKKRARFEKAWRKIEAAAETGEPVEGSVIEVVKGGLILDLGVRGFLPASLVDIRRVHNLDEFKGQTLECKVIELNRSRNNVVLSRRAVLEEERKEVREQILGRLQPGMVVEGKISNIVDFGAFVDLEGIDGLIHISELSWSHVNHPSEVLSIGETVRVKVLDIDRDRQRISLGLKQTQEDPWQTVLNEYKPNDILEGKVTKVVAFGAFIEIVPGVEGLVHISELAEHHVETPSEVVQPGQETWVRILEIDEERRRISLSVKRAQRNDNLPLRDLIPPELQPGNDAPPAPETGVPDLDLSEEVFSEPAPAEPAAEAPSAADPPAMAEAADPLPPPEQVVEETAAEDVVEEATARMVEETPPARRSKRPPPTTRPTAASPPNPAEHRAVAAARQPPVVGLTGAIAAGKSEALAALGRLGAATLSADAVVHELLASDRVRDLLVERWGTDAAPDGAVDRARGLEDRLRAAGGAGLARGYAASAGRRANRRLAGRVGSADPARSGRGAALVRDRDGSRLRRDDLDRRPGSRARRARGCARDLGARGARRPPALAGGEGAAGDLRGLQRRGDRGARGPARAAWSTTVAGRPVRRARLIVILVVIGVAGALIASKIDVGEAILAVTLPLRHEDIIRQQAERFEIDPALIAAVIQEESGFSDQTSSAGARGLMQITHATADTIETLSGGETFVYEDLANPELNIRYGSFYLNHLLDRFDGNVVAALAGYNGGPENVDDWGGPELEIDDIPFPETRAYVEEVLETREQYRDNYSDELGL